jgi:hypothetical protein
MRKKMLATSPTAATTYEMILYSQILSDMSLKMMTPIPRTTKLDMKVKVFLRLLSLS